MIRVYLEGVGLVGPGFTGWEEACPLLRGERAYAPRPTNVPPPKRLPAAEARRASQPVRVALHAADEAFSRRGLDPASVATVFTSSSGDGDNVHEIMQILATDRQAVSPTRFHNSVHNVAAGYWTIATGSRQPSTSLCAYDWSFAAGLLETASQVAVEMQPVALIAYDHPYPEPLHSKRRIGGTFATALIIAPGPGEHTLALLEIELKTTAECPVTRLSDAALESLRLAIPAARALPLLVALAARASEAIVFDYPAGGRLVVRSAPWA